MKKSKKLPIHKNSLGERLKGYSLLAGSMFASSIAAGQVIYTDVNPDVELGGIVPDSLPYDSAYALDLNNDGIFDFRITLHIEGTFSGTAYEFSERIQWENNSSNLIIPHTIGYAPFLQPIPCEDSIPFSFYEPFGFGFFALQNSDSVVYYWNNVHDGNIGLKVKVGSNAYWGWLRLDVNTNGTVPNIIIKDFAYEATPNKRIAACDTGLGFGLHAELLNTKNQFTLSPNPSNGRGTIKIEQPITGELELSVKDALGKEVYKSNFKTNAQQKELPFDFSHLSPGIYFVQLKSEEISLTEKWIKN
ncbi:MAG TPA: T9SS type A sorting domain-containing protein [Chitinophagales bacterium]|nr:T9SS type A sorting domain-containing protein [Chitinophagales bacterium]